MIAIANTLIPAAVCGVDVSPNNLRVEMQKDLDIDDGQRINLMSISTAGMCIGVVLCAALNDALGRRTIVLWGLIPGCALTAMQAFAQTYTQMSILRAGAGMFIGFAATVHGVYLAECIPIAFRGRIMLGSHIGYAIFAALLSFIKPHIGKVVFLQLTALPAALSAFFFLWFPESPRYLLLKGRNDEAVAAIKWLSCGSIVGDDLLPLNETSTQQEGAQTNTDIIDEYRHHLKKEDKVRFWQDFFNIGTPWMFLAIATAGCDTLFPAFIVPREQDPSNFLLACRGAEIVGDLIAIVFADLADRRVVFTGSMFLAAAATACTVTGPTSTRVAAAALQNVFEALPWLNILTLSCEAFPTESRAVGAASLRAVELFFIAATQSITGAAVGAGAGGALAHALAGVWVAGGLLGIALLFRTPPTVGKPIVESGPPHIA